jgi:hypothetical protein
MVESPHHPQPQGEEGSSRYTSRDDTEGLPRSQGLAPATMLHGRIWHLLPPSPPSANYWPNQPEFRGERGYWHSGSYHEGREVVGKGTGH